MRKLHLHLAIILFLLFSVFIANFSHTGFLMGWDNLMPEFNNLLNIKRSIFSAWQESHGLGVPAGNGHAADLPRQIFLSLLSIIIPLNLLRYIWVFAMLGLGTFSSYFLIKKLISENKDSLGPLLGSIFYLLNLATIQNFFIPFEPFITFFGFLPLLLLTAISYIKTPSKKYFLVFLITAIFALPLSHIPTIFFVYLGVLFFVTLGFYFQNKNYLKKIVKIFLATFLLNSFWLLPFIYFTLTNSGVAFSAKINQMSTPTVFGQNKEFGGILDLMLLKGFWFNNVDLVQIGMFERMFDTWRFHLENPLVIFVGYLSFLIILVGVVSALRSKNRSFWGFLLLFFISISLLSINTFPFSYLNSILREIPVFNQVFRSPFTKIATFASLSFALFFGVGINYLFEKLNKKVNGRLLEIALGSLFIFSLVFFSLPVFKGQLFYSKIKNNLPNEYFDLFNFFQKQDHNSRIANFPQNTFWGWTFYGWGYGGSGFIWYGLPQPVMDRAYDVWGEKNENYYWEISQALYSKNPEMFSLVLNKYQISWIIIDENIISSDSQKTLFNTELKEIILEIPDIKEVENFGKIRVYSLNLKDKPRDFVFLTGELPVTNAYRWGNQDVFYQNQGNYITLPNSENWYFNYFYPFRSLFSNKTKADQEFKIRENNESLDFIANLYPSQSLVTLSIPSFNQIENVIPIDIISQLTEGGRIRILAKLKTPEVFIKEDNIVSKIWEEQRESELFLIPQSSIFPVNLNINGTRDIELTKSEGRKRLGSAFLVKGEKNLITISNSSGILGSGVIASDSLDFSSEPIEINIPSIAKSTQIIVRVDKIEDNYLGFLQTPKHIAKNRLLNCDKYRRGKYDFELVNEGGVELLRFRSKGATGCISYYLPNLIHDQGYLILVENKNQKGNPLHFWVLNEDEDTAPINTYLTDNKTLTNSQIIIPPQERFGQAYSFNFQNPSIVDESINYLGDVATYPIPYNFLSRINLKSSNSIESESYMDNFQVSKINPSLYSVKLEDQIPSMIVLSQSYNKGWAAYDISSQQSEVGSWLAKVFPFIFGKELKNHFMVSNWENGWRILGNPEKVVIVYLPQYLQYLGFLLFLGGVVLIIKEK